jgi:SAM-dependent methyltransferase
MRNVTTTQAIRTASHQATNSKIFNLLVQEDIRDKRQLDIGAGRGYLASRVGDYLEQHGRSPRSILTACDLFPEYFEYTEVDCIKVDAIDRLPFDTGTFDIVYAVEVLEHLQNPYAFISDVYRIVKPGGKILLSVPNTLNLSSRISYFLHGFHEMFEPLSFRDEDAGRLCGHIMPLNYFYIEHGLRRRGSTRTVLHADKLKKSNLALYYVLGGLLKAAAGKFARGVSRKNPYLVEINRHSLAMMNSRTLLCSRSCIIEATKPM